MEYLDAIMAYEEGTLGEEDTVNLFQELVNSGLAWRLQGSYGRTATALLDAGLITSPFEVVADSDDTLAGEVVPHHNDIYGA